MDENQPLVTIAIPTYNRASLLERCIESALKQTYERIEVIVSDNASTDETQSICERYQAEDRRLKYIRQSRSIGATLNFKVSLSYGTGQLFMWLGDDDWIDPKYVDVCVRELMQDQSLAVVGGVTQYYRGRSKVYEESTRFSLLQNAWWRRVVLYYWHVVSNSFMYGVMRTAEVRKIKLEKILGGDWLFIARVLACGKAKVVSEAALHRAVGASTSYRNIVDSLGLPRSRTILPIGWIAGSAMSDILKYPAQPFWVRLILGALVFLVIVLKPVRWKAWSLRNRLRRIRCTR